MDPHLAARDEYVCVIYSNGDRHKEADDRRFASVVDAYVRAQQLRAEGKRVGIHHSIGSRSGSYLDPDEPIPE